MTIREATLEDAPAVATLALHFLATPHAGGHLSASRPTLELFASFLVEHPGCALLVAADDAGALVGFLALAGGLNPLDEAHAFCEELAWWVEPAARRAGQVGARLLAAAEQWARAHGHTSLKMVAPCQSRVGRFYERRGYVPLEIAYLKGLADEPRVVVRAEQGPPEIRPPEYD